jgi:hypothetical protein
MTPVSITIKVADAADPYPICRIVSVSCNESVKSSGDGDTSPGWQITGPLTLNLRAEGSGNQSSRV